ncbi:hypothetical protein T265_11412 [Opisthorchis viverrini]|uniref:Uncharacterized protein n=1 Tax=Opisthorchis viverrini TaxID=6198 RepID=A0A074Z9J6_OPIVI|nr:hypothetical protein T265_11412 [Opisthorchis viverrini]KER19920.1 hypothetical protein T265_11412 [Opisthorchis viverrini]
MEVARVCFLVVDQMTVDLFATLTMSPRLETKRLQANCQARSVRFPKVTSERPKPTETLKLHQNLNRVAVKHPGSSIIQAIQQSLPSVQARHRSTTEFDQYSNDSRSVRHTDDVSSTGDETFASQLPSPSQATRSVRFPKVTSERPKPTETLKLHQNLNRVAVKHPGSSIIQAIQQSLPSVQARHRSTTEFDQYSSGSTINIDWCSDSLDQCQKVPFK